MQQYGQTSRQPATSGTPSLAPQAIALAGSAGVGAATEGMSEYSDKRERRGVLEGKA